MSSPRPYRSSRYTDNEITKPSSLVEQRARQFEALKSVEVRSKECNWWLDKSKNVKDNSCDSEPDNSKSVENDDAVSEKLVTVEKQAGAHSSKDVIDKEKDVNLAGDNLSIGVGSVDGRAHSLDKDDDATVNCPIEITITEATNERVHFERSSAENRKIKLVHSIDEEQLATFQEYNSTDSTDVDLEAEEAEEANEREYENKASDENENETESKLANIVEELMDKEKTYIEKLSAGIKIYVEPLGAKKLPHSLRGQMYNIFANIIQIRDFHEKKFYPSLLACNGDVVAISDTFSMFIQDGYFYSYVLYAMSKKRSERLRDIPVNRAFFVDRQNEMADKLGVNSFLMEPIQRLPKYRLLIDQIAKVLTPFLEVEKARLAACCRAEKNVQRLLTTVNESISLNDIVECNDINLFHQGKFLRQNEFDVHDQESRRRYRGKVFLFEKSVVFTEKLEEIVFQYHGHYLRNNTGIIYNDGKKFELYTEKPGNRQIELASVDLGLIQTWVNLLREMFVKSVVQEIRKSDKKMHDIQIRNSLRPIDVVVRTNWSNNGRPSASGGSWTGSSSSCESINRDASSTYTSGASILSNVSTGDSDSARTTWYADME